MTDQEILENGFSKFAPSSSDKTGIIMRFQKRYDDENGKKYFITINKWSGWYHYHTGIRIPEQYEYEVQLYDIYNHNPINILFHSSWELQDVENYLEEMWDTGLFDYYEKWE